MVAISQTTFSSAFSPKSVSKNCIDKNLELFGAMGRRKIGEKPLHELMLTQLVVAYTRYKGGGGMLSQ